MPTMTLLPSTCAVNTAGEWDGNGGETSTGDKVACVRINDGAAHFLQEGDDTDLINFRFEDSLPVASGEVDSITSVQVKTYGSYPFRGSGGSDLTMQIDHFTGTLAEDAFNFPNIPAWYLRSGAVFTTNSSGGAISYAELQGIGLILKKRNPSNALRVTYIAIEVIYVATAVADNAIFFGHNF